MQKAPKDERTNNETQDTRVNKNSQTDQQDEETQAQKLIRLASGANLFCNQFGEATARIKVDGHYEIHLLRSKTFKLWLTKLFHEENNKPPAQESITQTLSLLDSKVVFGDNEQNVALRVGEGNGAIYYDQCDSMRRAVKITANHYKICKNPKIYFQRTPNMLPQVKPKTGGELELILKHINLVEEEHKLLFLVYLVSCLIPNIPHPLALFVGQQGSAKTTALRVVKKIIDPSRIAQMTMPKKLEDLALSMSKSWMPTFDNLTNITVEQSNLLCQASTGGGISRRTLYQNDDETILEVKRCLVLNGINSVATRSDLLDRTIIFELERIETTARKTEKQFWNEFNNDLPLIVGALFQTLSKAMAIYPTVKLSTHQRMADFTIWGYAIAQALGYEGEGFTKAYENNLNRGNQEAIESNPIAQAIIALMNEKTVWSGYMSELIDLLQTIANYHKIDTFSKGWPKSASILSRRLREVQPNLAEYGIKYLTKHDRKGSYIEIKNQKYNAEDNEEIPMVTNNNVGLTKKTRIRK